MKAGEGIGADYNPEIPADSEAGKISLRELPP